ncbi:MAG: hypothetical protein V4709_10930 [Pseudomonadota bacterium]
MSKPTSKPPAKTRPSETRFYKRVKADHEDLKQQLRTMVSQQGFDSPLITAALQEVEQNNAAPAPSPFTRMFSR